MPTYHPEQLVAAAKKYLGVPYRWSGHNPSTGLDCVGLVDQAYFTAGIPNPFGSVWPWTVSYEFGHWIYAKHAVGSVVPALGNILIWADSAGTLVHTGIALDANNCISAILPRVAIAPINAMRGEHLVWILEDTRFLIPDVITDPTPPPPPTAYYTVMPGDTLSGIAPRYGLSTAQLWAMNIAKVPVPRLMRVGTQLRVK
jgi:cell wall-associated NlpC family hydrolase